MLARHVDNRDDIAADLVVGLHHLGETRCVAHHQIVGEQNGKRLVANEGACAPNRMAEPEWRLLAGVGDLARLGQP